VVLSEGMETVLALRFGLWVNGVRALVRKVWCEEGMVVDISGIPKM